MEWLTEQEARDYIGRGRTCLWDWRKRGIVRARRMSDRSWQYSRGSLKLAAADAARRSAEQRHVPGPGRGHKRERNPDQISLFQ
ncbi:DNA binding protein [Gordonia phage Catfish]|uniref:Helix-turn-helix DNA binding domain protein n=1 Tax=Gordonia phage Catfish TaxID=2301538 RepID=A0A385D2H3_9CAUD|nr:DNA binding protein [Gordonia phage Catfish]AXQ51897.1 helix-turn-helix DNA-binding domain protein [Gordonia phage Catfish]